ncbi:MAG: hypothetical protein Fur0022_17100 [Anaerolineales bacterium]
MDQPVKPALIQMGKVYQTLIIESNDASAGAHGATHGLNITGTVGGVGEKVKHCAVMPKIISLFILAEFHRQGLVT